jgi:hypothetical protein
MLPPFIIEQIRKREQEVLERERPVLQIPLPDYPEPKAEEPSEEDEGTDRGVVIIDF